ncbi:DegT/DnrJ/EryC1/StrS family aminotransferase [Rhabdothermincola sediminis]|uniref:DegT/DnrJ/EryC1/StrS family aminotransferase n=1 Tax=Rhabdothermincola sediminis TaxID=2751370 RepID=UPI001AA02EC2|nr:aminotransferase class I/II-fold pyridoxal phosphate-dependent enzyme [Rhabdothermincola sediminis]
MARIFLSPPDVGPDERELLLDAVDSNWVSPLGPHVDAFERELAAYVGVGHAAALSSGTAGLHLALLLHGVGPGDEVLVPTLTFIATASAVIYTGATPVFVDAEPSTWCVDPALVDTALRRRVKAGRLPKAVIAVDLYGQCADYDELEAVCGELGVALIEDAAEALGARYHGRAAGSFGRLGVFSFNGNKIITTSGGGMLVSDDRALVERARFLATQARDPAPHYEHSTVGFNYRMSNLLAAVGRGQLRHLDEKVARRRAINRRYRAALADLPGVGFLPNAAGGEPTNWLTVITLDPAAAAATPEELRVALEAADIEARPAWKPMHLQPVFAGAERLGGQVAERIFTTGLCLPSGSSLTHDDQERVIATIRSVLAGSHQVPA